MDPVWLVASTIIFLWCATPGFARSIPRSRGSCLELLSWRSLARIGPRHPAPPQGFMLPLYMFSYRSMVSNPVFVFLAVHSYSYFFWFPTHAWFIEKIESGYTKHVVALRPHALRSSEEPRPSSITTSEPARQRRCARFCVSSMELPRNMLSPDLH